MRHVDLQTLKRLIPFGLSDKLGVPDPSLDEDGASDRFFIPGENRPIGRALAHLPHPLIDPERKIVVVFSAKSACTNVVIWFLHQLGHAQAARDYNRWPHRYRDRVYYRSELFRRGCREDLRSFRLVRVVRDPYQRAVSSFRHVLRHARLSAEASRVLGRSIEDGMSFATFLDFLGKVDLANCNPHYRQQRHPIEDFVPDRHLINVSRENLFARLGEIEAELGLPKSNLAESGWVKALSERHHRGPVEPPSGDQYTRVMTRQDARTENWPSYALLLTPEAKARIAKLYAADFKAYGIEP